jgi:hypothetical protein
MERPNSILLTNKTKLFRPYGLAALVVGLIGPTLAATPPLATRANESQVRPDLVGGVKGAKGVPRATIFISTAGPKVGTSTFCPSCYADCRKSAKTEAEGTFKIESLDPQLLFRILVVAPGYKPKFVSKVDPAKGPISIDLHSSRLRKSGMVVIIEGLANQ